MGVPHMNVKVQRHTVALKEPRTEGTPAGSAGVASGVLSRLLREYPPRAALFTFALSIASVAVPRAKAQQPSTPTDTLLQQLSADTQRLYLSVRTSIVRVQLPTPHWLDQLNTRRDLLQKWGPQLSPEVREKLVEQERLAMEKRSTTQPSTQPAPQNPLVLLATGMLIDGDGHAVVPVFVDRTSVGEVPLRILLGDGHVTVARFLGSDRKTNLSVWQLSQFPHEPVRLAPSRPEDGTLALVIAPDGSSRLVVWNSMHAESGLIVSPDGAIAGFGFNGQFLGAAACKPLVDQIVATGAVHRAVLGVRVREVGRDDSIRQQLPELGNHPAIAVMQVDPGSAADHGGVCAGDLILTIDSQPVGDGPTFAAVIAGRRGQTPLRVLRRGEVVELMVELKAD